MFIAQRSLFPKWSKPKASRKGTQWAHYPKLDTSLHTSLCTK